MPPRMPTSTLRFISAVALLLAGALRAQSPNVLSVVPPEKVTVKFGSTAEVKLSVQLRPGYHCNSNMPADEYLIPLKLTWNPGALEAVEVVYPKAQMENYKFSDKPVSVFLGDFEILTRFKVAANAAPGLGAVTAKLRYQACTDRMCLTPKTVDVTLPIAIVK